MVGSSLGTVLGAFAGLLAGGLIKSLCYDDGPDGFILLPLGVLLGAMGGGAVGGSAFKPRRP